MFGSPVLGGDLGVIPSRLASDLVTWGAIAVPFMSYSHRCQPPLYKFWWRILLYTVLIVALNTLSCVLWRLPELGRHPQWLWGLPVFMGQQRGMLTHDALNFLRSLFFAQYSESLMPRSSLLLVALPELLYPGAIATVLSLDITRVLEGTKGCVSLFNGRWQASRRSLLLIGGLLAVLGIIVYQEAKGGVFTAAFAVNAIDLVTRSLLLPVILFVLFVAIVRTQYWRQLESWH